MSALFAKGKSSIGKSEIIGEIVELRHIETK